MRMLKKSLLDDDLTCTDIRGRNDFDEAVRRSLVAQLAGSAKERYARFAARERRDMITFVMHTCIVTLYIVSSTMSFLTASGITASERVVELMFALSILFGPTVLYQRFIITYGNRMQREAIDEMWKRKEKLKQKNEDLKVNATILLQKAFALKKSEETLKAVAKKSGFIITDAVMDLYNENKSINQSMKAILEAMTLDKIVRMILKSDVNRDHTIGEAELNILALRIDAAAGTNIPFTVEELCNRFRLVESRSINSFADTALVLYIEKRQEKE